MGASLGELRQLRAYMRASKELSGWISGARVLALLSGALESGVLELLETGSTPQGIAAATGLEQRDIEDLCLALKAYGIVTDEGAGYRLTPDYALLASSRAAVPLASVLRQATVMLRTLQAPPRKAAYSALPPTEILAMAEGAGISALSAAPHVSAEVMAKSMPEVETLWRAGGRHLEVGCGVGNALLGIAATYPRVTAVGIEIDGVTAAEAQRRAEVLRVADRVEVRRMDACNLHDEGRYATIQWSQFFFPAASRPLVLEAMHRALRPGGYLFMPRLGAVSGSDAGRRKEMLGLALRTARPGGVAFLAFLLDVLGDTPRRREVERRFAALLKVLFARWGVPVPTIDDLESELQVGGFRVLRATYAPVSQFALTRGFLLVQRA
jgi:SAM-dependent methyltransferase